MELDKYGKKALDLVMKGNSLFITGKAGPGKTTVVKSRLVVSDYDVMSWCLLLLALQPRMPEELPYILFSIFRLDYICQE